MARPLAQLQRFHEKATEILAALAEPPDNAER